MDLTERIFELAQSGYFCGQILAKLLLETIGKENTGLVKAMGGLNGGAGFSSGLCGCMTGGCCLISYFTGKGGDTSFDVFHFLLNIFSAFFSLVIALNPFSGFLE